jgi:hypothetical protein
MNTWMNGAAILYHSLSNVCEHVLLLIYIYIYTSTHIHTRYTQCCNMPGKKRRKFAIFNTLTPHVQICTAWATAGPSASKEQPLFRSCSTVGAGQTSETRFLEVRANFLEVCPKVLRSWPELLRTLDKVLRSWDKVLRSWDKVLRSLQPEVCLRQKHTFLTQPKFLEVGTNF